MADPMEDAVLMGFAYGREHPLFKAVMAELAAYREAKVQEAITAPADREQNRALGAAEVLDDVRVKFEANVSAVIRKLEQDAARSGT